MKIKKMQYCKKCVYPISAVNLSISEDGICSSCKVFEKFSNINEIEWNLRKKKCHPLV